MENYNERIRLMPLPGGERRGTSGADAGRDSMRTVSGSSLNRRAGVGESEEITAEIIRDADDTLRDVDRNGPTSPAGASDSTTTSSHNGDSRRKWSQDELHELLFCYYRAKAEGSGYIKRFEKIFKERNQHNPKASRFTGNTLSNQARSIITRKVISTELLDEIKLKAEQSLVQANTNTSLDNSEPIVTDFNQTPTLDTQTPSIISNPININTETLYDMHMIPTSIVDSDSTSQHIVVDDNQDPIILQFLQTLAETKEIAIADRKLLPKPKFNKKFINNFNTINIYIKRLLITNNTLRELNDIIYSVAKTLIIANGQKPYTPPSIIKPKKDPPWKLRIKNKIEEIRKELGRLIEIKRGVNTRRMIQIRDNLYYKYNIFTEQDHDNTVEILNQKVKALAGRIKRYDDINNRKIQNQKFSENQHSFYRSLNGYQQQAPTQIPNKDAIQDFWSSILSQPVSYNKDATWISEIQKEADSIQEHRFEEIDIEMVQAALRKTHNWKTPGIDKIQNYYLKYLTSTHEHITKLFNRILNKTDPVENWFTTGQVILIPKNENTNEPQNWRPIACLPTMYKLLTSVLSNELYKHCETNDIIASEQRGCRRRARGCKDHLMINKAILEDAHQCQKNLSMGWVDYRKAFDSISHEWLLQVLRLYKCSGAIIGFLEMVMPTWNVIMTARGASTSVTTDPIRICRGIFQGDSLSPLLFCLGINPISTILNKYILKGYKLKSNLSVNHLIYMDDLKVYANNKNSLKILLDSTETFTRDIGMQFGLNKCNVLHITAGRVSEQHGEGHTLLSGLRFEHLKKDETYKYLGINEAGKIDHNRIRDQLKKEYFGRIKSIANTHLNARNQIKAINTYAVPVLLYSFGIINYKNSDLKNIDVKTRKILAINKAQKQKADIIRLYLPIEEGGRGLTNIETLYKTQIIKYKQYLHNEQDDIIKIIVRHDRNKDKYSIHKESRTNAVEIGLQQSNNYTDKEIKSATVQKAIEKWRAKPLHGQFCKAVLEKTNIDKKYSFNWLKKQPLSSSLESSVFAIQDQAIMTKQFERDILKRPVDGKCRLCLTKDETTQHIISGCEKLAGTYYTRRHNNIVQYIFWALARKHKFEVSSLWWQEALTQPQIKENETAKLMWEIPVQTDVTVTHNRPDIIYVNKTENKTYLIDITVPSDYNIGPKEIEKLSKYHLLKTEITRLWNTSTEVIPVVIGATGIVAKSIHRYCDKLDADINIHFIQKQAAIHTVTILSKVLGDTVFVSD